MADVARLAGVNRVTASVALRGARAGTHVSEATRQRILHAARELGYTPNAIAIALRQQRTNILGYLVAFGYLNPHDPFTAAVLEGLQNCCRRHGQDLLTIGSSPRRSLDDMYAALTNGKIDGLVLLPALGNQLVGRLVRSHLPLIAIANTAWDAPAVLVDDVAGARLQAQHLAERGHRRVMYRCLPSPDLTSVLARLLAFVDAAAEHGIRVDLATMEDWSGGLGPSERELLALPRGQRPTAAVCWSDTYAYLLIQDCLKRGIRVPDDLAVVGFDGVDLRVPAFRRLTTVRAPWTEVAVTAVDLLLELVEGRSIAPRTVLPVELLTGDTT